MRRKKARVRGVRKEIGWSIKVDLCITNNKVPRMAIFDHIKSQC